MYYHHLIFHQVYLLYYHNHKICNSKIIKYTTCLDSKYPFVLKSFNNHFIIIILSLPFVDLRS